MGFLDALFEANDRRQELIRQAERVGSFENVIRLGILAAQLGLTEGDLQKMARVYVLLGGLDGVQARYIDRVFRAIQVANEGD